MAYTYLIGWTKLDKFYYGVRYAADATPRDLWESYFTSSKYVKEFREKHGPPDIIKIRKIFGDPNKAREWETKFLKKVKAVSNEKFLNKTDNISIDPEAALRGSLKSTNKGAIRKDLSEINSKKIGEKNHMFGKKGELAPHFGRTGEKHPMFGKKNPNAAEAAKITIKCPHCSKEANKGNYRRWHGDNCKKLKNVS